MIQFKVMLYIAYKCVAQVGYMVGRTGNIYPSPMRSVCDDMVVDVCVSVLALNRLIASFS